MLGMGTSHLTAPSGHPLTLGIALGVSPLPSYGLPSPVPGSALCVEQRDAVSAAPSSKIGPQVLCMRRGQGETGR